MVYFLKYQVPVLTKQPILDFRVKMQINIYSTSAPEMNMIGLLLEKLLLF